MNDAKPKPPGAARFVPGLTLLQEVSSALLRSELVVAITVFAVLVPSAMAYGELAGVTPVAGLYVALAAMLMYALFGTSRQVIMGPEAAIAIMTAAALVPLAGGDPARHAALAAMTALLVGLLALVARVARLGFITDFLSKPILIGFISGTALIVIGSQLGKLFGIKLENDEFFGQVAELIRRISETHLLTFAIGVICIAALLIIRRVNRTLPGPLLIVIGAILASMLFNLQDRGVKVVGPVPAGLPMPAFPAVGAQDILALLPAAIALTIVIYADEVLTARSFAAKHGQKIDANQEFVAIGLANIGAGLLSGFPAGTSASRTSVADQLGGKSQLVGLIAVALTVVFLLFLTPLLSPLPTVALGAIIVVASIGLFDVAALRFLRGVRPAEFWLALTTMLGVVTVGVLQGILIAVMLSLVNVIYHISRPNDALLDAVEAGGGTVYRSVADGATPLSAPGLIVYRFDAPLVFANAAYFTERLETLIAHAGDELRCVILDAEAISDFDSTAAEALENLHADLERRNVVFWVARANKSLRHLLQTTGLTVRIGQDNIYPSMRAAVMAYQSQIDL